MSIHGLQIKIHIRAGTQIHSAISSSSPISLTHLSFHMNTLCVPQHKARLPLRTGFQRALSTGLLWSNTLRNRGVNSCWGAGKSKIWTAVGVLSTRERLNFEEDPEYVTNTPNRTRSSSPVLFHSSWVGPLFWLSLVRSERTESTCIPWRLSSMMYTVNNTTYISSCSVSQDRNPRPSVDSIHFEGSCQTFWQIFWWVVYSTENHGWIIPLTTDVGIRDVKSKVATVDQLMLSRTYIYKKLNAWELDMFRWYTDSIMPAGGNQEHPIRMPRNDSDAENWIRIRRKCHQ